MSAAPMPSLPRRAVSEALGTAMLLATVVGSGIMGERLAGGNVAIALLANTVATGAMLVALISTFGPLSRAQLNPAVTLAVAWEGGLPWTDVPAYVGAQLLGAIAATGVLRWRAPTLPAVAPRVVARSLEGNRSGAPS
jgi:glycerol uptake facilitator-like aquaporin